MSSFFSILNSLFDLMFWPFRRLGPVWPVLFFSFLAAVLLLLVFRHASNQAAIRRAKDLLGAHLLEVRLFQERLGVMRRAYGRLLRASGAYLLLSLKPLAVMLAPLVLLMAQMELRLGRAPLQPGAPVLVKAQFADEGALHSAALRVPEGVHLTAPALRIPEQREINWRLEVLRPGEFALGVSAAGETVSKQLVSGAELRRVSPLRTSSMMDLLLYPGEPKLTGNSVRAVEILYPPREVRIFGWATHWLIPFFIFTLLFGYALKGVVGAEF
jgi:hypothetical protein